MSDADLQLPQLHAFLQNFVNALLVHAEKTGTRSFPISETCISESFIYTLQFANGSLHTNAELEKEIIDSDVNVPLLSHEQFPGDTSEGIGEEEWNRTAAYLMETRDARINMSLVTLPSELTIRCDPYTETTCEELSKFPNPSNLNISAETLTTQMTSLVSHLVARGANATKATQLLLHNTAYVYLSTRCHKDKTAELGVPLSFAAEYGRLVASLTNGNTLKDAAKQGLSYKQVQKCLPKQIDVLSGYASAGSVPEKIVAVSGKLEEFVLKLERSEVEDGSLTASRQVMCKQWERTRVHGACMSMMRAVELMRQSVPFRRQDHEDPISTEMAACVAALKEPSEGSKITVRAVSRMDNLCEPGYNYVPGMTDGDEDVISNCCADICVHGVEGLQFMAGREFMRSCCRTCNQVSCEREGELDAREQERIKQFTLDVPPYGTAKGLVRTIML